MKAHACIVAEAAASGCTRLSSLRCEPPLVLRSTPNGVFLVGAAAGPLGGDDLAIEIVVREGASLTVRSAAASLALPGPAGEQSRLVIDAEVAARGSLGWLPEPAIAGAGCNHRTDARIRLAAGAHLVWREELVFGRAGEPSGTIASRTSCELDGRALLRTETGAGPGFDGWNGPAVLGDVRAAGSILFCRPGLESGKPAPAVMDRSTCLLPLEGPAMLFAARAADPLELRKLLEEGLKSWS